MPTAKVDTARSKDSTIICKTKFENCHTGLLGQTRKSSGAKMHLDVNWWRLEVFDQFPFMFTKQIMSTTAHLGRTRFIPSTSLQSIVLPQVEGFPGPHEEAASHTHTQGSGRRTTGYLSGR